MQSFWSISHKTGDTYGIQRHLLGCLMPNNFIVEFLHSRATHAKPNINESSL